MAHRLGSNHCRKGGGRRTANALVKLVGITSRRERLELATEKHEKPEHGRAAQPCSASRQYANVLMRRSCVCVCVCAVARSQASLTTATFVEFGAAV